VLYILTTAITEKLGGGYFVMLPWNSVILEKFVVTQLKKISALYGTRRLFTVITGAGYWIGS
jgi:hypothetical protein